MALKTTIIDIPMDGGMDESSDSYVLSPPAMLSVKNGVYDKAGRISKRHGYRQLTRTGLPTSGIGVPNSIFPYKNQLCAHTTRSVFALSEDNASWQDTSDGGTWPCDLVSRPVVRSGVNSLHHDTAITNGFICTVWETKYGDPAWTPGQGGESRPVISAIWYMVEEEATGNIVIFPTKLEGAYALPHVVAVGQKFILTALDDALGTSVKVRAAAINTAATPIIPPGGVTATLQTATNPIAQYDVASSGSDFVVAVGEVAAAQIDLFQFDEAFTALNTATVALPAQPGFGLHYSPQNLAYALGALDTVAGKLRASGGVNIAMSAVYDVFATSITQTPAITVAAKDAGDTRLMWFLSGTKPNTISPDDDVDILEWAESNLTGGPGAKHTQYWLKLATKAWTPPIGPVMVGVRTSTSYGNPYSTEQSAEDGRRRAMPAFSHGYSVGLIVTPYQREAVQEFYLRPVARFHQSKVSYDIDEAYYLTHVSPLAVDTDEYIFTRTVQIKADATRFSSGWLRHVTDGGGHADWEGRRVIDSPFTGEAFSGGDRVNLDLYPGPIKSRDLGHAVVHTGGVVGVYDGQLSTEISPHTAPPRVWVTLANTTSTSLGLNMNVAYAAMFFWEDAVGNIHRSAPSPVAPHETYLANGVYYGGAINLAGASVNAKVTKVSVKAPIPSGVDGKYDRRLFVALYRAVNPNAKMGSALGQIDLASVYRESGQFHLDCVVSVHPTRITSNGMIEIFPEDGLHGASAWNTEFEELGARALLYTSGGVLPAEAPPAFRDVLVTNGRVFGISGEDTNSVWYSKPLEEGVAPEFNGNLQILCPAEGGSLTALAALDDKVVLFKERRVYVVTGDGADALGSNGGYSPPQLVSGDVGCIEKNSVAEGPFGVIFRAERGFFLLDRSLSVSFIGVAIQDVQVDGLGLPFTVHSAVVNTDSNEVRFACKAGTGGAPEFGALNRTFVYNYLYNKWSYFEGDGVKSIHTCLWQGVYTRMTSDWYPYAEFDYKDDGTLHIPVEIVTPWIRPAGDHKSYRFRRARVLAQRVTDNLKVEIGYDYKATYDSTFTFSDWSQAVDHMEIHIPRQKCAAIRFKFTFTDPTTSRGEGMYIPRLSLDVGVKPGLHKNIATTSRK